MTLEEAMEDQSDLPPAHISNKFSCIVRKCDRNPLTVKQQKRLAKSKNKCATLGTIKHECVEEKLKNEPDFKSERTYDTDKKPPEILVDANGVETCGFYAARAAINARGLGWGKGRWKRPDAVSGNHVFDAKFPCSQKVKGGGASGPGPHLSAHGVSGSSMMTEDQRDSYRKIAGSSGTVTAVSPHDAKGLKC